MLDDLEEIESDLSVLHRIDDMGAMPARRFWRLVAHLESYGGAVAVKHRSARPDPRQEGPPMPPTPPAPTPAPVSPPQGPPARPGVEMVGATEAELRLSSIGDLISFGRSGG